MCLSCFPLHLLCPSHRGAPVSIPTHTLPLLAAGSPEWEGNREGSVGWCAGWEGGFLVSSVDLGSQGFYLWAGEVSAHCLGGDLTGHFLAAQETPFCHPPLRACQVTQSSAS